MDDRPVPAYETMDLYGRMAHGTRHGYPTEDPRLVLAPETHAALHDKPAEHTHEAAQQPQKGPTP